MAHAGRRHRRRGQGRCLGVPRCGDLVTSRAGRQLRTLAGIERGAVACLDWPPVAGNAGDVAAIAAGAREVAPRLGAAIVWDNTPQCISWPRPAANPPHRLSIDDDAPPILLVAGRHDPNDPYAWALSVARQIPPERPAHKPARRARRVLPLPLRPALRRPVPNHPRPRPEAHLRMTAPRPTSSFRPPPHRPHPSPGDTIGSLIRGVVTRRRPQTAAASSTFPATSPSW